jgi:hypothetical protein
VVCELECSLSQLSFCRGVLLDVAPASPFIVPKGRARGYNYGKKVKGGKNEREKQKGGLGRGRLPPYPARAVYPIVQGHNGRRAFDFYPLVQRAVATL